MLMRTSAIRSPLKQGCQVVPSLSLQWVKSERDPASLQHAAPTAQSAMQHDFGRLAVQPTAKPTVQAKLEVSQPGDSYEREADRVAETVMRMADSAPQNACACGGSCSKCQGQQSKSNLTQTGGEVTTAAPPVIQREAESDVNVVPSGGRLLDNASREYFEPRFGQSFADVRIHDDTEADRSARAMSAVAYTVGRDIIFRGGAFAPKTTEGKGLLAHELTHVVQQSGGSAPQGGIPTATTPQAMLQRREVCNEEGTCWTEDDSVPSEPVDEPSASPEVSEDPTAFDQMPEEPAAATPTPEDPTAFYQMPEEPAAAAPTPEDPTEFYQDPTEFYQMPEEPTASTSEGEEWDTFNNPIWNTVTNNTVSGTTAFMENAWEGVNTMPILTRALMNAKGVKGLEMGLKIEDALAAPANASRVLAPTAALGKISPASAALAPLGVISNAISLSQSLDKDKGLEKIGNVGSSAAGLFASSVGTVGLAGAGLTAAGATGAGAALTGAAAAAGPAAAVAGAGAAGYAAGRLLDEGVGGLMNVTGASDAIDSLRGIQRPKGQHGDYSLSGMAGTATAAVDQGITNTLRDIGVLDKSRPEYTQTVGWWLAENLPSWMQ